MSKSLLTLLRASENRLSKTDRPFSAHFERNLHELPFETAKPIAERVGVSQMTIGRYLRRLGFDDLDGLKQHLRHGEHRTARQVTGHFDRLQKDAQVDRLTGLQDHVGDFED